LNENDATLPVRSFRWSVNSSGGAPVTSLYASKVPSDREAWTEPMLGLPSARHFIVAPQARRD
jgi:hypothetical protein